MHSWASNECCNCLRFGGLGRREDVLCMRERGGMWSKGRLWQNIVSKMVMTRFPISRDLLYNVTVSLLSLRSELSVPSPLNLGKPVAMAEVMLPDVQSYTIKVSAASTRGSWTLAPCCEEPPATGRGHTQMFWKAASGEVSNDLTCEQGSHDDTYLQCGCCLTEATWETLRKDHPTESS